MKRRKKKKILRKFIITIFVLLLSALAIYKSGLIDKYLLDSKLKSLNYSDYTIKLFKEENITKAVLKENKYSHTLDVMINSEYFKNDYTTKYLAIDYHNDEKFKENINKLLDIGYDEKEINTFYEKLNNDSLNILIANSKNDHISNYLSLAYFKENKLARYLTYPKESTDEDLVTYVNIGLDNAYYTNVTNISDPNNLLVLCNKYNKLASDFVPTDLVTVDTNLSTKNNLLRKDAYEAFQKMVSAAQIDGITFYVGSGYRSYSYQSGLYNAYVARDGKEKADTYSARPGYSEHQTGLGMDLTNQK